MTDRLEAIRRAYLNQDMREFLDQGGNAREYARLVFAGEIFGPNQDPRAPELDVHTAEDLAEALEALAAREAEEALDEAPTWTGADERQGFATAEALDPDPEGRNV